MKKLLITLILVSSVCAWGDSSRSVSTDNLNCTGAMADKPDITLEIRSAAGSNRTNIMVRDIDGIPMLFMTATDLRVTYEGDYYISQVPAEYNLGLYGEGLEELLAGGTHRPN